MGRAERRPATGLAQGERRGRGRCGSSCPRRSRQGGLTLWADLDEPVVFDDGCFNAVVAGEVVEHVRCPELMLTEARRLLVPGGNAVGSLPNCFRLKSRLRFVVGRPLEPADEATCLKRVRPADYRAFALGLRAARGSLRRGSA